MKLKNKINSLSYWVFPPFFWKLFRTLRIHKKPVPAAGQLDLESRLRNFEEEGLNYFFDASAIPAFCRMKREVYLTGGYKELNDATLNTHLHELADNGFTIIPSFLSQGQVDHLNTDLHGVVESEIDFMRKSLEDINVRITSKVITRNLMDVKCSHNLYDGVIRIWGAEKICQNLHDIADDKRLRDVCEAYLGGILSPSNVYLDIKAFSQMSDSSVTLHADSHAKICKIFIPLEDVTDNSAPFLYFRGSHKQHEFKFLKDFLEFCGLNKKYHDFFNQYNIISLFKVAEENNGVDIEPIRIALKAGDAIIVDTSGIHGATDLISGRRVQLGLVFEQRGFGATDKAI
jgi:hypothetical protein